ncbi:TetR/AcrR family transcriptional regulator [Novosphingobium sp. M1R2S20]|uniref:TetR/AcrR family transcriptional regulator n=1 Tax=Novosphingobium rhizovicinum TaxID=3228928 RepID=A0ABV3RCE9_9SPHN
MTSASIRPASSSVRSNLLDAAERLFARHGLEGVSLRQISAAAGTRNNYAVQSHFGDAAGLIRAVIERRAAQMELRRAELLGQLVGTEDISLRQLFAVIYLPILDGSKAGEPAVFAQFNLTLLTSPRGYEPLDEVYADKPVTRRTLELIVAACSHVEPAVAWRRVQFAGVGFLAAAIAAYSVIETEEHYRAAIADALEMAAAALAAPAVPTT